MNHEDYCSCELSKKLKEKGFDEDVLACWRQIDGETPVLWETPMINQKNVTISHSVKAPLLSQAQKWLREEKGIIVEIVIYSVLGEIVWDYGIFNIRNENILFDDILNGEYYHYESTYEKSLSAGITKALELI